MKKQLAVLAIAGSMIFAMSHAVSAETPIKVVVGGERVKTDVAPIIVEGRTMLPVRAVFEAIGADVDYIAAERKVVATRKDKTVEFVIDSNIMKINGQEKQIDVPAMIKDDRTLVPLRACAEAFDLDVEWNDKTRTAKVKKEVSVATESFEFGKTTKHSYDENGNLIYSTSSDGSWKKYDYDENKNMIYFEDSFGYWTKYTYDENGYNTLWEDPVLGIIEIENDKNGNKIYAKDSGGAVWEYEYDERGNLILEKLSGHYNTKYIYDEHNRLIYKETYGGMETTTYTYDENNNLIYEERSNGDWIKYTYDENGNRTYKEDSDGNWEKYIVVVK